MPTSEKCSDSRDSGPSLVNLVALKERMRSAIDRAQGTRPTQTYPMFTQSH